MKWSPLVRLKRAYALGLVAVFLCLPATACRERELTVTEQLVRDGGVKGGEGGGGTGTGDAAGGGSFDALPVMDALVRFDACVPTGRPEICNELDDDCNGMIDDISAELRKSTESCGSCAVVCEVAKGQENVVPVCTEQGCAFTCADGTFDTNRNINDGCECLLSAAAQDATSTVPELTCDNRDNDCDGMTDEGFDKGVDLAHCEGCNQACGFPFAMAKCETGKCVMTECLPGYFDRNGMAQDGCESPCQKTNNGVEICDGVDNDCDGALDEAAEIAGSRIACKQMGVCAGVQAVCMGQQGWVCPYPASYEEVETKAKGCDTLDNDCDGVADEPYLVGTTCSTPAGVRGDCAATGALRCKADKTDVECSAVANQPQPELCDGRDNDCDGKTDELTSEADRTTDDKLIYLAGPNATIFVHEASRFDATAQNPGREAGRPCSVPNRLPWANLTKEQAQASCAAIGAGWRLCTQAEWTAACQRAGTQRFPYGATFDAKICNGADYDKGAGVTTIPTGTAKNAGGTQCVSLDGFWDMSGNVREWVLSGAPTANPLTYEIRGGAYNTPSLNDGDGMSCESQVPAPSVDVQLPSVGFRCCRTGRLP